MTNEAAMKLSAAPIRFQRVEARAQRRGFRAVRMNLNGSMTPTRIGRARPERRGLPGTQRPDETIIFAIGTIPAARRSTATTR
jgi:hypothetical protein